VDLDADEADLDSETDADLVAETEADLDADEEAETVEDFDSDFDPEDTDFDPLTLFDVEFDEEPSKHYLDVFR